MAIVINNTRPINGDDSQKWIEITVNTDGDDCKFTHVAPSDLSGDALQAYVDGREDFYKRELLRNMYEGADVYNSSLEDFEGWVSAGAKNAEVKQEIPAVTKKDAVYEDVETEPAIEAQDEIPAVMGERQKETSKEVDKSEVKIVKEGGKYVQKTVTSKEAVKEPVLEEVSLYNEDGDEIGKHSIPVMESYEVEPAVPAVEAVDAVTEKRLVSEAVKAVAKKTLVIQPEVTIEKKVWVDSH